MKILMNNKVLFISVLIYMILAIFLPLPKPEFVPSTNFVPIWSFLYGYGQSIIIGITLVITVVMCFNDKVDEYLNRLVSIKWTYIATYLIMIATMILFVVEIPGLWWSWTTIGFLVVMVLLAPIILKDIVPKIDALLMGAGVAYFIMGAWETPYQYGLWKYYEASQGLSFMGILGNLEFNLPFVLMGLSIVTFIALKNSELLKNVYDVKLSSLFFGITVACFLIWFATGFWCGMYFDIKTDTWIMNPFNYEIASLIRMSKITINLSFLSLIGFWNLSRNRKWKEIKC
jgi:hypothetical protein